MDEESGSSRCCEMEEVCKVGGGKYVPQVYLGTPFRDRLGGGTLKLAALHPNKQRSNRGNRALP